jgi:hypothetical protein
MPWYVATTVKWPPRSRDENGQKSSISIFVSTFFSGNRSGFGKCGFESEIGICGHTKTDKYRWRAGKLN